MLNGMFERSGDVDQSFRKTLIAAVLLELGGPGAK
jgi:hypothetical protein